MSSPSPRPSPDPSTYSTASLVKASAFAFAGVAIPSALVSVAEGSWAPLFTCFVLVTLHGVILGTPAYWLLSWCKALGARPIVIVGALIGALPTALILADASGPGVRYWQSVSLGALTGAAFGFLFWLYLSKYGKPPEGSPELVEQMMRNFQRPAFRKKLTLASDIFRSFPALPSDAVERRTEVRDFRVAIDPGPNGPRSYVVTIKNTGKATYRNVEVDIRNILLWAECFSLDTTHMPADQQYAGQGAVRVETLGPQAVASVEVTGYGTHDAYDYGRTRYARVSFDPVPGQEPAGLQRWCEVTVKLPGARLRMD